MWTRDGEPLLDVPHGGIVRGAAFSTDGRHVATASSLGTARIWPITDEELRRLADELPFRDFEPGERERLLHGR